jgi:endo-1,3(4)-beta-glucanase
MIPIAAHSALVRRKKFVQEEWDTYFSNGRVDKVGGGWRGILYSNLALIDPKAAYKFFSAKIFDPSWLDGGASRTWYLAYCAALGGA